MRWLMLIGLSLLAGCDEVPDQPKTPTPPKVTVSPADAAAPIVAEPKLDRRVGPVSIESEDEPALAANPGQPTTEPIAPTPAPKAKRSAAEPKTKLQKVELPEPDLDLSLPEDWTENLDPAEEPTSLSLLPPLFESSESRSLQMSGELLPGAAQDEALIDGAQINFELKR